MFGAGKRTFEKASATLFAAVGFRHVTCLKDE
jgi:hypothetical protein